MPPTESPTVCPQCKASLPALAGEHACSFCPACRFPLMLVAGKYQLLRELAVGGFGVVYLARHMGLQHQSLRAVKLIKPEVFAVAGMKERFAREVHVTSLLSQRNLNIVRIYDDFGEIPNLGYYYVMEYIEGLSLRELMERESLLSLGLCQHIFLQLCEAMQTAHKAKIVHRDLKPANLMLLQVDDDPHFLKVLDFGIARPFKKQGKQSSSLLQLTHGVLGTPLYMSPEQWLGKNVDERSDIYAMGVILFELLTGRHPLLASASSSPDAKPSAREVMALHLYHSPLSLSAACPPERELPLGLVALVKKALAKRPSERFASAAAMQAAFVEAMGAPGLVPASLCLRRESGSGGLAGERITPGGLVDTPSLQGTSAYGAMAESGDNAPGRLPYVETMEAPEPTAEGVPPTPALPTPSASFDVFRAYEGPEASASPDEDDAPTESPSQDAQGDGGSPGLGPVSPWRDGEGRGASAELPSWQTAATAYSPFAFFLAGAISLSVLLALALGLSWLWTGSRGGARSPARRAGHATDPVAPADRPASLVPSRRRRASLAAPRKKVAAVRVMPPSHPRGAAAPPKASRSAPSAAALGAAARRRSSARPRPAKRRRRPRARLKRRSRRTPAWQRLVKGCPQTPYFWTLLLISTKQRRGSRPRLSAGQVVPHPQGFCVGVRKKSAALTLGRSQERFVPCTLRPAKLPPRAQVALIEEGSIEPTSPGYCASP